MTKKKSIERIMPQLTKAGDESNNET